MEGSFGNEGAHKFFFTFERLFSSHGRNWALKMKGISLLKKRRKPYSMCSAAKNQPSTTHSMYTQAHFNNLKWQKIIAFYVINPFKKFVVQG